MYRKLEPRELSSFAYAWREYQLWQDADRFAQEVYGPAADTVTVEVEYVYDDMAAYYPSVTDVTVKNAQGEILEPDLSTPWWKEYLGDALTGDDADGAYEQQIDDAIDERRYDIEAPHEDTTWQIAEPPALPFADLYVVDGGATR